MRPASKKESAYPRLETSLMPLAIISSLAFFVLFAGCSFLPSNTANTLIGNQLANSSSNNSSAKQIEVSNVCTTVQLKPCPDGSPSYRVECTSGYNRTFVCPDNPYNKNLSKVPENLQYFSKFSCYWNLREGSKYGPLYDPFVVCKMQGPGWEQACTCADEIEAYAKKYGVPK